MKTTWQKETLLIISNFFFYYEAFKENICTRERVNSPKFGLIRAFLISHFSRIHTLIGHKAEIRSAQFNYDCSLIATGSMDKTCKIWETNHGERK